MTAAGEPGAERRDARPFRDWGGLILAGALIAVGGYFLLRNTFGVTLPDIPWDQLWPVLVIILGIVAMARGSTGHSRRHRRRDRS
jgi:hypothetical protein